MTSSKRHMTDGLELPNSDKIRILGENETLKYLDILVADTIKQVQMKDKIQKEYCKRTRELLETKLNSRNLIKGINTCAVPGHFLKWTKDEFKIMDKRTRKLMSMHKALHHRDDVDRLYLSRKVREIGLASIEDSVDASIQRFEDCIGKHEGGLFTAIKNESDYTMKNRKKTTRETTKKTKMGRKSTIWVF